jgi:hypothetical protein
MPHPSPKVDTAVVDADDTLFPTMQSMGRDTHPEIVQAIVAQTGYSSDEIRAAIRIVYAQRGTVDYYPVARDIPFLKDHPKFENIDTALINLRRAARDRLKVFAGIKEGLEECQTVGISNRIVVTDSPWPHALDKLIRTGLAPHITHLVALKAAEDADFAGVEHYASGFKAPFRITITDHQKPHTDLEGITGKSAEEIAHEVALWDDHEEKGTALANRYGLLFHHCIYSTFAHLTDQEREEVRYFSPSQNLIVSSHKYETSTHHPHSEIVKVTSSEQFLHHLRQRNFYRFPQK